MKFKIFLGLMFTAFFNIGSMSAQWNYQDYNGLTKNLQQISQNNKNIVSLKSIGKSSGGRDIWLVSLNKGGVKKPGVLIVGGVDGHHRSGTEIVAGLINEQIKDTEKLNEFNFYYIPSLNPDAILTSTGQLITRSGNATTIDNDRDGYLDEDPVEDLNNDGLISWIRVSHPGGDYVIDAKDSRLMVKVKDGMVGGSRYLLFQEGIDNDKDGLYNEDGPGGVNIDKNFAFEFPFGTKEAGHYAVSESETKAFMDFLAENQEIFVVIHIGPSDNLTEPPTHSKQSGESRILKSVTEVDAKVYSTISQTYKKETGVAKTNLEAPGPGSLTQTVYFHTGRWSFVTPGWSPSTTEVKKDSIDNKSSGRRSFWGGGKNQGDDEKENKDATLLKWADENNISNAFIPWKEISHPDFKDYRVEVGGVNTVMHFNPPSVYLDSVIIKHQKFISLLTEMAPKLQILQDKVEKLDGDIYRVSIEIYNSGAIPTNSEISEKLKYNSKLKLGAKLSNSQSLVSGKKNTFPGALQPGERKEFSWLVSGKGKFTVEVGSATTNNIVKTFDLK